MFESINQNKELFNSWVKGDILKEEGEFERVLSTFYSPWYLKENSLALSDFLVSQYDKLSPVVLNERLWSELENTESFDVSGMEDVKKIIGDKRDWEDLENSFTNNSKMESPIIARFPDGKTHLISGNTRLCVAKAKNIVPMVYIIDFPKQFGSV